jgi:hypothetical protein
MEADHHGSIYGGLRSGQIANEQVKVEQATWFQSRHYPVRNGQRLNQVFSGAEARDIGLVQNVPQASACRPDTSLRCWLQSACHGLT